ncbi:hypothetical protein [Histidinibacterium aquaticum]|nr:hypothetical protein [Histidinibacterium aquaticum]
MRPGSEMRGTPAREATATRAFVVLIAVLGGILALALMRGPA